MGRRAKNPDIENQFKEIRKESLEVLKGYRSLKILEGEIYFIDEVGMKRLIGLEQKLNGVLETDSDRKRFGFGLICRLLNADEAAQTYFTGVKGKHRQINDQGKVREHIEGEFAKWCNITSKNTRDYADAHEITGPDLDRLMLENEKRITEARAQFDFIMANFESLEIRIVGWEHEKIYPYISYSCDKKAYNKHLSIEVPSVLWLELARFRSDMNVADFVKNGINAFGDVYYVDREKIEVEN